MIYWLKFACLNATEKFVFYSKLNEIRKSIQASRNTSLSTRDTVSPMHSTSHVPEWHAGLTVAVVLLILQLMVAALIVVVLKYIEKCQVRGEI